jgi:ribosomal protein L17
MLFNKGQQQISKENQKTDATKTLALQLMKLKEMAQGMKKAKEDDERIEMLKAKKKELDRQNAIVEKIKDPENIAILSRHTEINYNSRIETVKLPQIYQQKPLNERNDEGYELLRGYQKLMGTRMES